MTNGLTGWSGGYEEKDWKIRLRRFGKRHVVGAIGVGIKLGLYITCIVKSAHRRASTMEGTKRSR